MNFTTKHGNNYVMFVSYIRFAILVYITVLLRNLTRTADSGGSNHVPRPRFGFEIMAAAWPCLLALLPMNEPVMYVISAERSRENVKKNVEEKVGKKKL